MSVKTYLAMVIAALVALPFSVPPRSAEAQDSPTENGGNAGHREEKKDRSSGGASGFFSHDRVDFWGDAPKRVPVKASGTSSSMESIWAEPRLGADGRMTIYLPRREVLQFLENPTRENARTYLEWQETRMKRLKVAMDLLSQLERERREESPDKNSPEEGKGRSARDGSPSETKEIPESTRFSSPPKLSGEVLYFKKPGCPYCLEEDKALALLVKSSPGLKVRTLMPEDSPKLWKEYGVRVVPTLVVPGAGGKRIMVRGYVSEGELSKVLAEADREKH